MEFTFDYLDNEMNSIFTEKRECEDAMEASQLAKKLFANSMQNDLSAIEVSGIYSFIIN